MVSTIFFYANLASFIFMAIRGTHFLCLGCKFSSSMCMLQIAKFYILCSKRSVFYVVNIVMSYILRCKYSLFNVASSQALCCCVDLFNI